VIKFGFKYLVLALLVSAALAGPGRAAEPAMIEQLVVTNSASEVLLYGQVKNAFVPEMEEAVRNGLPVTFTFFVELHRRRTGWPDQKIADFSFEHLLVYDSLKEEYRVTHGEKNDRVFTVKSLDEARRLMVRVNGLAVAPLAALAPEQRYTLRIKARLSEKTLPLSFHRIVPFWRLWNFETEWHQVEFRY